jgi:UDP-N-acetylglucosamine--N-acetylmuramyl-(pentapeptide) pyrophosphoryl-undecaprenol N-acetylglucosamine transferase
MKFILSGGGTGGHIYPAIAIANELKKRDPDAEILFVGAQDKMEMEKVPAAGYEIKGLWISGLQRKLTARNLLFPIKLIASKFKARNIIRDFKPDIVIGTGGFASGSVLNEASAMGYRTLIQEQNSYAGLTNKILGRKADTICVAYEGMEAYFPANKIVLTGNPVRSDIIDSRITKQEALVHFGLDQKRKTLLVLGGSLGAGTINKAIAAGKEKLLSRGFNVLWQTGKNYYDTYHHLEEQAFHIRPFIADMVQAYACADVVISRAGALSIAEISCAGKPCILVPSPNVAEDHQTKNARALQKNDAAILIKDIDAVSILVNAAVDLLENDDKKNFLSGNIKKISHPDAVIKIADEVLKLVNK